MRFLPIRCLLCAGVLTASTLFSQTLGTVTGEVRDSTGAVIPGVEVTVRNTGTNVARTVTTNEEGVYAVPALNPGTYDVKASKSGFKTSTRSPFELQVQQTARVDFSLDIGQVSESVEVAGAASLLTTENATVGTIIEQQRITDLPLNGRNFLSLVALSPNVTYGFSAPAQAGGRQGGTRAGVTMSLSGARSTWSNYTLDGITNTDINFNLYVVLPSVEALQEFKVQTGIYPAEFGRAAGQVNVSTKGGTNDYHGAAFEYLRNDKFDARPYFFKDPESPTQVAPEKQPYRQNQYGFTLAGPVRIPKLIDGRNRVFFMSNFEGFKSRRTQTLFATTMTPAMRAGDFSAIPTALQDANTRTGTGSAARSNPFPGNQIPVERFSKGSLLLLEKFAPIANLVQTGQPNRNYQYLSKTPIDKDQFTQRIDLNQSPSSQWFGRYSWTDELTVNPGIKLNGSILYTRASQWVLANTKVFSSSKVNEARFGYNSLLNNISQELAGTEDVNAELGTPIKISDPNSWGIPNISLTAPLNGFGNDANGPFTIDDKVYQITDNFSWVRGKHSFRIGGEWRYNQYLQIGNEFARGRFTANSLFTASVGGTSQTGGFSGADFLLGYFNQLDTAVALAKGDFRNHEWALYVDDTYKVTPRLTINWGLRWEVAQPLWDKFGNEVSFQIRQPLPSIANDPNLNLHPVYARAGSGNFYDGVDFRYNTALQVARDGRLGKRLIGTDYNNYGPRLGIAYSPSAKWSFRTGFGIFFSQESKNSIFDLNRGMGGRASVIQDTTAPSKVSYTDFINAAQLPVFFPPGLTWGVDNDLATTYTMSYLFNIQRAFGNNTTLEVGYTGSQSRKLGLLTDANAPLPGSGLPSSRQPYPELPAGIQFLVGDGIGSYNSLSGKLTQRFGRDFTTLFSYTWSKSLDDISSIRGAGSEFAPQNARCRSCEHGPSTFNVPHRFVASVLYSLPVGRGKRFLDRGGIVNQVLGGWQVSTITTIQSGAPINTASWNSPGLALVPNSVRLNCVAGVNPVADNPTPDRYFVREAFQNTITGQFGSCGRNNLIGPRTWNIDFSTLKDFRINEAHALQFRLEMFNAPNHPAWGSPSASWGNTNAPPAPPNPAFGRIRSTSQLRLIQFALKYHF